MQFCAVLCKLLLDEEEAIYSKNCMNLHKFAQNCINLQARLTPNSLFLGFFISQVRLRFFSDFLEIDSVHWQVESSESGVFSILATDGRGELLRMREDSSGVSKLELAEKITYFDVERWNQINQQLFELERIRQLEAERQKTVQRGFELEL